MDDGKRNIECYNNDVPHFNLIWKSENILESYGPIFAVQLIFFIFTTRFIYYIMRPINLPRQVAEIIGGGVLLSQGLFGNKLNMVVLPNKGIVVINTVSYLAIIFSVFLAGLEINLEHVLRAPKKATSIAVASTIIPMLLGSSIYGMCIRLARSPIDMKGTGAPKSSLMWGSAVGMTCFPVLFQVLADLKIIYTGLGKLAISTATIIYFYNWVIFAILVPFATNFTYGIYSVICTTIFCLFCFFVLRPLLAHKIIEKTNLNEWDNYHFSLVIVGVLICATVTDLTGTHPVVGAFVFGLILPRGRFVEVLIDKTDEIASVYLGPLFYVSLLFRFDLPNTIHNVGWFALVIVMFLLWTTKIIGTLITTRFFGMHVRESVALGLLLNTKGVLAILLLNHAHDKKCLSKEAYTVMVLASIAMTAVTPPMINLMYKPRKQLEKNKQRTIQNLKSDAEIRIMACVHNTRQATGMINILEAFSSMNLPPIRVSALKLVEVKGRAATVMNSHMDQQPHSNITGADNRNRSQEDLNSITKIFESYAEEHDYNRVETLVAVSSFASIHEDVYNLGVEKQASLLLLPFHKQSSVEGPLDITNPAIGEVNQNIMKNAPCSVGILVDRGLESLLRTKLRIIMLFIGGPDDREALAIAWRMSRHPSINLSMVRIGLMGEAAEVDTSNKFEARGLLSEVLDNDKQRELDEEYVDSFRLLAVNNEDSITYAEKEVHNSDGIPEVLNELDQKDYDLYILGQGNGRHSVVLSEMLKWTDCPELGVIGDIVASNTFGSRSSVLVVQQYGFGRMEFGAFLSSQPSSMKIFSRFL